VKVVIAHDYLMQRGGAERVVLEMVRAFPGSTVLTSMYLPDRTYPQFAEAEVRSLGLERFPPFARDPRLALPVLGEVLRRQIVDADLLLCSSSGFSHQLRSRGPKVVYCHNPPRWLHQRDDYAMGLGTVERAGLRVLDPYLSRQDRRGARGAAAYIANSANVAERIRAAYGIRADVLNPPRGLDPEGAVEAVPDLEPGFLLTVGRSRGYKRTELLLEAVAGMPDITLVSVGTAPDDRWPANVRQLIDVSDAQLRWLYASARGLLACSREDFGLTPVEAFGFGIPVGATPEGGYLETCREGLTGLWLDAASTDSLRESIRRLLSRPWDGQAIRAHGRRWTAEAFHQALRDRVSAVVP
jgi:glycosyltransferase involved in cell wall biosynthesis